LKILTDTSHRGIDKGGPTSYDSGSIDGLGKESTVLHLMRKHAKSWLIKMALGAIIIVFVFLYGWTGPEDTAGNYVAEVNGTVISDSHFQTVLEVEREKLRMRFRGSIPPAISEKLEKQLLDRLIDQELLLQEAKRLGYFITDEDLVYSIRHNPVFQTNGVFDERRYREYLRILKMNPAYFEYVRRHELLEEKLVGLLTDGVKYDPAEIKQFWHFQNDKLVLSMLVLRPTEMKIGATADEKALEAYFQKNQEKYEIPASVDVDYVSFSWKDFAKKLTVTEEDARSYYGNNPGEFVVPERIRARHILLKKPEDADKEKLDRLLKKAEEIVAAIKGGADFEEKAKKESQDDATSGKGGDLGFFSRGTMNKDFEEAAFKLDPGEISDPVRTSEGYHVIRVEENIPEKTLEFELVRDKIINKIKAAQAKQKVNSEADDFYEQVYRSEELGEPARKYDFKVKTARSVTRGQGLPEVGADLKIMDELFALKTDEISSLMRAGDDFVIMKVVKKHPARLPKLDEARLIAEKDFLKREALKKAREEARQIIEDLKKKPTDWESLAKKHSLTWEKLDPVPRTAGLVPKLGTAPEVSEMLATVSTEAPVFPTPVPVPDGIAVFRLLEVMPAGEEDYEQQEQMFKGVIVQVRKTEYLEGWLKLLRDRAKIDIGTRVR
jgi:peptidyl-prolyl cis-trans isomerase D